MDNNLPSIDIIIPTLNCAGALRECLESIMLQDYGGRVRVIVADGGSTDETVKVAKQFGCEIVPNPARTGEAGKAAGLKAATGDVVALIDSDNILVGEDWLERMASPFNNPDISGSEPIRYEYRKSDPPLTRYCALIGMNDPLCHFLGNYDRENTLTGRWTGLHVETLDREGWLELKLEEDSIPTMGANGFMVRLDLLKELGVADYLFDIDVVHALVKTGHNRFAKVKTGIVHIYGRGISDLARKQLRRVRDYRYYTSKGEREYPWNRQKKAGILRFILYCLLVVPLIGQAIKGYRRVPDSAWALHLPACMITLAIYAYGFIEGSVKPRKQKRDNWKQGF